MKLLGFTLFDHSANSLGSEKLKCFPYFFIIIFFESSIFSSCSSVYCEIENSSGKIIKQFVTIHHKKFTKNRHYPLFKEIQM